VWVADAKEADKSLYDRMLKDVKSRGAEKTTIYIVIAFLRVL